MRKNKGFTLVELLVVISIIAILLAILMPSMKKAQEQARFVVCKSNFKTYGLAIAMYLQASNNSFPHPCDCLYTVATLSSSHPAWCRWHDSSVTPDGPLWPYIRDKNVSFCPTFARIARINGRFHGDGKSANHLASIPINSQFTYSVNGFLSAGNERENLMVTYPENRMPKITSVKRPSDVMFLTEENYWNMNDGYERTTPFINYNVIVGGTKLNLSFCGLNDMYFMPDRTGSTLSARNGDCIATFHKAADAKFLTGYSSVLFVDGHVGAEKAYDGKTTATTVRRSWQLATGKDQ
jgi:prepilin-type N-terminal cleavage/methylation domain-containing protein/prepilin-type processing-associated H-X9-DG protein